MADTSPRSRELPQENLPLAIWRFEGMPGRDDKCANVRATEVVDLFQWQRSAALVRGSAAFVRSICGKDLRTAISEFCRNLFPMVALFIFQHCFYWFFALASFAEVGFVCGKSQEIVASAFLTREGGEGQQASWRKFIVVHTQSRRVCKRNAFQRMRYRLVIGGLRRRPSDATSRLRTLHRCGGFQTRLIPTRNGA
jgi:hypothetical protein